MQPDTVSLPLSDKQVAQYHRDGCLLVSGLIPEPIAARAEAAMWECLRIDPNTPPASWENFHSGIRLYNHADLVNCYTLDCLAAASQLTGEDAATFSKTDTHPKTYCAPDFLEAEKAKEDLTRFFRWDCAYVINVFPTIGEWMLQEPHIDHSLPEHYHKTFPAVFRIGALTYLSDVEHHGGGTVVWRGSHRKIAAIAKADLKRYAYRNALSQDMPEMALGEPVELQPRRGDVLFLHHLCAHAGSQNLSTRPRFALNMKW